MSESPNAGLSPLDQAHGLAGSGNHEQALTIVVAILERYLAESALSGDMGGAPPRPPLDAALLAADLLGSHAPHATQTSCLVLRDAFVNAGDLPLSVVAAHIAAGSRGDAALRETLGPVAAAYHRESPRLGDAARTPPTLPQTKFEVPSDLQSLAGETLASRCVTALEQCISAIDSETDANPLPRLPLFSSLSEPGLLRLLTLLTPNNLATGETLIEQGADGKALYVVARGMLEAFTSTRDEETRLAALGPGSVVGEMALVSDAPRAASVRSVEPTLVLTINKDSLEQEASRETGIGEALAQFCQHRMLNNLMKHSFALSALTKDEKRRLLDRFQSRSFEKGAALVRQGEEGPGLFLVAAGHVRVTTADDEGDELVVAELGPGEAVGEISLVLRRPASATVAATHATVALFLPSSDFQAVVAEHPGLLQKLYGLAVDRDDELQSVVAQEALELDDITLV